MEYFLGVDGGGSKTKFVLTDCFLNIIKSKLTDGCDFHHIGVDGVCNIFFKGTQEVFNGLEEDFGSIKSAVWGIPCYGETADIDLKIISYLQKMLPNAKQEFHNDVYLGLAGSLALGSGIHIVSGTGAIAVGKDDRGNILRCSGWDEHFGDEGSSYWLGINTLRLFSKEADGRKPKGPLYSIIKNYFGLKKDFDIIDYYYKELIEKREKIAKIQLLLYEAAIEGDCCAVNLYEEAAYELSLSVKMLIGKMSFKEKKILISYSGGTFKAGDLILKPFCNFLLEYPIKLIKPMFEPAIGAVLLASREFVDPKLYRNLKKIRG